MEIYMRDHPSVLGCRIDPLSMLAALDRVEGFIEQADPKESSHIITLNAEIAYQAYYDPALRDLINRAAMVTPDGIGIVWGARQLGIDVPGRVTGIDLMERICQRAASRGWKIYLLGAEPGIAEQAARNLQQRYPGLIIAGVHHGYFQPDEEPEIIADIIRTAPQVLFVGLGAPRQEWWIDQYKDQLQVPVCIGVGGSLDVISGHKQRAPEWAIKLNLEWLYRLATEPSRFKRQLVLPRFVGLIIKSRLRKRS
ncbi:MAG TPA: WecB/TagA/CpsF family glycosyltransferase [Syntrophomonadaceae bacterium]|nr:WecB/TagA/CpsF family glycosyltransferase [Syntrophomonadaceae bacterium]